ncbi:uroporphyrinogen-III synthase [Mesorhizobium sp.]|uniref:uroporphyrinogen-III synthase n=1 Tax=Mesorhizobium sp. TaxID=1871066 RepID=UPI001217015E|nr:uroporphyrinogen-III synthase [Mesorhizobium sp.]TIL69355.1 MAG: uroporphyrinogen-III synthase [Mesorhizobium sp.]
MRRVLVTRPEPGASRTAQRLEDLGFKPILLPLTETVALPVDADGVAANAAAVAVTSANAVRHAPKEISTALAGLHCHAVGRRTAEAARAAGFLSVGEGPGDAESLADALAADYAGQTIVYLCGRVRFSGFEQRLQPAGVQVRVVETYDTVALDYSDEAVLARLSGRPVEAVLLYSAKAATAVQALAGRPALGELFKKTSFFALSGRIAAALETVASKKLRVAPEPTEEALLELLRTSP